MLTREKLLKLLETKRISRTEIAARVGIAYSTFRTYLDEAPRVPAADTGVLIARALDVPSDWLFDDSQDWPPPEQFNIGQVHDAVLINELLARRNRLKRTIDDWVAKVGSHLGMWPSVENMPHPVMQEVIGKIMEGVALACDTLDELVRVDNRFSQLDQAGPDGVTRNQIATLKAIAGDHLAKLEKQHPDVYEKVKQSMKKLVDWSMQEIAEGRDPADGTPPR